MTNAHFVYNQWYEKILLLIFNVWVTSIFLFLSFLGHKSHKKCIALYLMSEAGKKSKYLCPMRCDTFAQWDWDKYVYNFLDLNKYIFI
jgi:hypothetical protein